MKNSGSIIVGPSSDDAKWYCISEFEICLTALNETQFVVGDNSIYEGSMIDAAGKEIEVKMRTPQEQEISFFIPVGGKRYFSAEELGLYRMHDGIYCFSVESCRIKTSIDVPLFDKLERDLEQLFITEADKDYYEGLMKELEYSKQGVRHGLHKEATKVYESIRRRIKNCSRVQCD